MYMPLDIAQRFLIFAGVIGGRQDRQQSCRRGQSLGPAGSASKVSWQGQSAGGAQKESASAAVSKLSTAAVVAAPLMAVFCV